MPEPWIFAGESPSLGQPGGTVTLVEGSAFCISGRSGDVFPGSPQGLFFRVKEGRPEQEGETEIESGEREIRFRWRRGATRRGAKVTFAQPAQIAVNLAVFEVIVPPRGSWSTCVQLTPVIDDDEIEPRY